jgi:hypothetical protein
MKEKKEETFRKKLENRLKKQARLIISRKEEISFKEYVLKLQKSGSEIYLL